MEFDNLILQQLDQLDLDSLSEVIGMLPHNSGFLGINEIKSFLLQIIYGESIFDLDMFTSNLLKSFLGQVQNSLSVCSMLLLVSMLSGLFTGLTESFGKHTVSRIGSMICVLITVSLSAAEFVRIYQSCMETIDVMIISVQSLFPVLFPLVVASGSAVSGSIVHPLILSLITAVSTVAERWFLPGIFYSCSLCLVGRMVNQSFLNKTGKLIKDGVVFALGLTVTLLSAVTALQGTVGRSADSLLMKTARYSVDNFIPFIGGFAADSMDMVIQCTTTIKNAVGIWGILVLIVLMVGPLIRLTAVLLIFRLGSVVTEAISEPMISGCMEDIASSITTLAVIYTLLGILFIVFLTIIISIL